ncbi:unnamed protein product [Aspergillus oryzae RIB40]|uniref:DNA, SC111 n=2 Tax=Aspergillus oryzae TaxID=5062 RepID=Q2U7J8_ASPOR|nr:unnamed protein product [Aspergillus oryzae RIB40]EIT81393.1 hypothetical protein Ao3042_02091 [Aspergillus oryzae 3.042]KDE83554.1 hypothetical protein AO1008_10160 [Aspergillus oryzae 100-8]BAE62467.1 unnamed protein product [Aspergillus oryzae RIB40]|eukprot:EIT81393.1 hypothetical protein Ao3042_02091 [Aspergillus oryzae 3.042]
MPYMHTSSISPTPILPNTSTSQHVPRKTKSSLPSLFYDTTSSLPLILHLNLQPPHTTTNSKMSTILLILYLYTITTLLNPGWAQTNQYSPSHPHLNQPQITLTMKHQKNTPKPLLNPRYPLLPARLPPKPGNALLCLTHQSRASLLQYRVRFLPVYIQAFLEREALIHLQIGAGNGGIGYESSLAAGDAICAFNGTGYTRMRGTVEVPGARICDVESGSIDGLERVDIVSLEKGVGSMMGSSQSYGLESGSSHAVTSSLSAVWGSFQPVTVSVAGEMGEPVQRKRELWFCFDRGRSRSMDPGDRVVVTVFGSGSSWMSSVVRSQETTMDSEGVVVSRLGLGMGMGSTRALSSTYVSTSTGSLAALNGTSTVGFPVATGSVGGCGALVVEGTWVGFF